MTHVVATAGHVDHGKSTLVRALTGMETDRLAEEHRRGLSIELGFAWTTWPEIGRVAFVDVPGHRRFLRTTLAGLGPVPVVLFVVAADEGWMPQSAEHLAALHALGVEQGVLVVTKADRTDPGPALAQAKAALAGSTLAGLPAVAVIATSGAGLDGLREWLVDVLAARAGPDPDAPVRFWVDRAFTVTGAGRIVTGTLPEGTITVGDELADASGCRHRVRGLESYGQRLDAVRGTTRVAINVRGRAPLGRGDVLLMPGAYLSTSVLDVRLCGTDNGWNRHSTGREEWAAGFRDARSPQPDPGWQGLASHGPAGSAPAWPDLTWQGVARPDLALHGMNQLGQSAVLHTGTAAVRCRVRRLGDEHARLTLAAALPLRIGDRAIVRDPGRPAALVGVRILAVAPRPLIGRGAAALRGAELAPLRTPVDIAEDVVSASPGRVEELQAMGLPADVGFEVAPGWRVSSSGWDALAGRLAALVTEDARRDPLGRPRPVASAAQELGLEPALVPALAAHAGWRVVDGTIRPAGPSGGATELHPGLGRLTERLAERPFDAPNVDELATLELDAATLAAAGRDGLVLRLTERVVVGPGADTAALDLLADLPASFRVSDVCAALGTTRRTAVPLLERLARLGRTRRLPDGRHTLVRR